jgi:hypothetical protein
MLTNFPFKSDFALAIYPQRTSSAVNWRGASLKGAIFRAFCDAHKRAILREKLREIPAPSNTCSHC